MLSSSTDLVLLTENTEVLSETEGWVAIEKLLPGHNVLGLRDGKFGAVKIMGVSKSQYNGVIKSRPGGSTYYEWKSGRTRHKSTFLENAEYEDDFTDIENVPYSGNLYCLAFDGTIVFRNPLRRLWVNGRLEMCGNPTYREVLDIVIEGEGERIPKADIKITTHTEKQTGPPTTFGPDYCFITKCQKIQQNVS